MSKFSPSSGVNFSELLRVTTKAVETARGIFALIVLRRIINHASKKWLGQDLGYAVCFKLTRIPTEACQEKKYIFDHFLFVRYSSLVCRDRVVLLLSIMTVPSSLYSKIRCGFVTNNFCHISSSIIHSRSFLICARSSTSRKPSISLRRCSSVLPLRVTPS